MRRTHLLAALGLVAAIALVIVAPQAALAGWRAAFIVASAVPIGAIVLLLIARLTGADWGAALVPLTTLFPLIAIAFVPVVVGQALFVAHGAHLAFYLWWPLFALRSLVALGFWWWLASLLRRDRLGVVHAGVALLAQGVIVTFIATDWLLGAAPPQPNSAVAMALTTLQIAAATGTACLLRLGAEGTRRDLSYLLVAACLGLGYLMFMDYLIVWFGDLPSRVGWYVDRRAAPWSIIPPLALLAGIVLPIGLVVRAASHGGARPIASGSALVALLLVAAWEVSPAGGWLGLLAVAAGTLVMAPLVVRGTVR